MKKLGPIYLIRHGETVWNRASRLQGHKDTPLTMKGVKQAQALGFALKGVLKNKTPSFYSSPIGRAKQTAAIISDIIDFDVERIEYKSALKEITFGDWDGLNMQEILTQYKTSWEKRKTDKWNTSLLMARAFKKQKTCTHLLDEIAHQQDVVIVAHGSLNKIIRGCWCNLSEAETLSLDEPQDGFYCLVNENREYFVSV